MNDTCRTCGGNAVTADAKELTIYENQGLQPSDEALDERDYGDLGGLDKANANRRFGAERVGDWRRSL